MCSMWSIEQMPKIVEELRDIRCFHFFLDSLINNTKSHIT